MNGEIDRLANFLMKRFPREPGRTGVSESAVDVAIRLLTSLPVECLDCGGGELLQGTGRVKASGAPNPFFLCAACGAQYSLVQLTSGKRGRG